MPAAAVIPAPLAYIKVAAVKKLVVGSRDRVGVSVSFSAVHAVGGRCGALALPERSPADAGVPPLLCSPPSRLVGCP